jgi:hypothetical protein
LGIHTSPQKFSVNVQKMRHIAPFSRSASQSWIGLSAGGPAQLCGFLTMSSDFFRRRVESIASIKYLSALETGILFS